MFTGALARLCKLSFFTTSAGQETDKLHNAGVNIIVALGYEDIFVDREVTRTLAQVDIWLEGIDIYPDLLVCSTNSYTDIGCKLNMN